MRSDLAAVRLGIAERSAAMTVRRIAFDVDRHTVGARVGGHGPAVAVLGPLDRSSRAVAPLVDELARTHLVVAVDPAGYGSSEPLPTGWDIAATAKWLAAALDALGLGTAPLVGVGSGGLAALELADSRLVVLDDVPLLDAPARARLLDSYAPANPIRGDGTHVLAHWAMRRAERLWFPWFDQTPQAALDVDLHDVADLHAAVLDAVHAGLRWAEPYLAVWSYDAPARLAAVDVQALVPSTPLLGTAARAVPAGPDPVHRRAAIAALVAASASTATSTVVAPERDRDRWVRAYADTPWGQVAAWSHRPGAETERPLVLLHASPLAGRSLRPLADGLIGGRRVILLDTVGNGDSDVPDPDRHPQFRAPAAGDLAAVALAALTDLGVGEVDVYGTHTGAVIGLEMALAAPQRVARLILNGVPLFDAATARTSQQDYLVNLTPLWDGTHLLRAWSNIVDVLTWFPWYEREPAHRRAIAMPDAVTLHDRFDQFAAGGTGYHLSHGAVFRHRTRERIAGLAVPTLFCRAAGDPLTPYLVDAAALVTGAEVLEIGVSPGEASSVIHHWLASRRKVTT